MLNTANTVILDNPLNVTFAKDISIRKANAKISVIEGPDSGKVYELVEGNNHVGRGPHNNLLITDPTVSRQHLVIVKNSDKYKFNDLGSKWGVYLNDQQVSENLLNPGDVLEIGRTALSFEISGISKLNIPNKLSLDFKNNSVKECRFEVDGLPNFALNPNANVSNLQKSLAKKKAKQIVKDVLNNSEADIYIPETPFQKANLKLEFVCNYRDIHRNNRDMDNLIASVKPYIDAIREAGIIFDDSAVRLTLEPKYRFGGRSKIIFTITDRTKIDSGRSSLGLKSVEEVDSNNGRPAVKDLNVKEPTVAEYFNSGIAFAKSREYQKAIKCFNQVIELNPKSKLAYEKRAFAYDALGEYGKAIIDFSHIIETDSQSANIFSRRGFLYYRINQYKKSEEDYKKAFSLDKDQNFLNEPLNDGFRYYAGSHILDKEAAKDCIKKLAKSDKEQSKYLHKLVTKRRNSVTEYQLWQHANQFILKREELRLKMLNELTSKINKISSLQKDGDSLGQLSAIEKAIKELLDEIQIAKSGREIIPDSIENLNQDFDSQKSVDAVIDAILSDSKVDSVIDQPKKEKTLYQLLNLKGLTVIDRRKYGGALWVKGGEELKPVLSEFMQMSIRFTYCPAGTYLTDGKPAWRTEDQG